MRPKIGLALLAAVLLLSPVNSSRAAQFESPKNSNGNLVISKDVNDDLYAAGGSVSLEGNVSGNAFLAGGSMNVSSKITNDLFLAGGNLTVAAIVSGSSHIAGGNITITSPVSKDLMVGGGNVTITKDSAVGRDLVVGAGNLLLQAPVARDVKIGGGEIYINSAIKGNVEVAAKKLTFGPNSNITGTINYRGSEPAIVEAGAKVENIQYTHVAMSERPNQDQVKQFFAFAIIIKLLAMLITAIVIRKMCKKTIEATVADTYTNFSKNVLTGFAVMVLVPIVSVLLFVTILGYYLGLVLMATYFLALLLAGVVALQFAGGLVYKWIKKTPQVAVSLGTLLLGTVVMGILSVIPVLGWLAVGVLYLASLGALTWKLKT